MEVVTVDAFARVAEQRHGGAAAPSAFQLQTEARGARHDYPSVVDAIGRVVDPFRDKRSGKLPQQSSYYNERRLPRYRMSRIPMNSP